MTGKRIILREGQDPPLRGWTRAVGYLVGIATPVCALVRNDMGGTMVGVGAICDRPQSYRISFRANAVRPYVSFCSPLREGQDPPLRGLGEGGLTFGGDCHGRKRPRNDVVLMVAGCKKPHPSQKSKIFASPSREGPLREGPLREGLCRMTRPSRMVALFRCFRTHITREKGRFGTVL